MNNVEVWIDFFPFLIADTRVSNTNFLHDKLVSCHRTFERIFDDSVQFRSLN